MGGGTMDGARWAAVKQMFTDLRSRANDCEGVLRQSVTVNNEDVQADREVLEARKQHEELQNKASMMEVENQMIKGSLSDLQHEISGLQTEINSRDSDKAILNEKNAELEGRNQVLENEIKGVDKERKNYDSQIEELNKKIQAQQSTIKDYEMAQGMSQEQMKTMMDAIHAANEEALAAHDANQDLKNEVNEAEGRAVRIVMQARKLEQDHKDKEAMLLEH